MEPKFKVGDEVKYKTIFKVKVAGMLKVVDVTPFPEWSPIYKCQSITNGVCIHIGESELDLHWRPKFKVGDKVRPIDDGVYINWIYHGNYGVVTGYVSGTVEVLVSGHQYTFAENILKLCQEPSELESLKTEVESLKSKLAETEEKIKKMEKKENEVPKLDIGQIWMDPLDNEFYISTQSWKSSDVYLIDFFGRIRITPSYFNTKPVPFKYIGLAKDVLQVKVNK